MYKMQVLETVSSCVSFQKATGYAVPLDGHYPVIARRQGKAEESDTGVQVECLAASPRPENVFRQNLEKPTMSLEEASGVQLIAQLPDLDLHLALRQQRSLRSGTQNSSVSDHQVQPLGGHGR